MATAAPSGQPGVQGVGQPGGALPGQPGAGHYAEPVSGQPGVPPAGHYPGAYPSGPYAPPPGGMPSYPPPTPPRHPDETMGMVGFILALVGLVLSCCGCTLVLCPVGLILCIIAHTRRPTGLSLAGIIIGGVGTLGFIAYAIWAAYLGAHPGVSEQMMREMFNQMGIPMPHGFPGR
jgi:uncharacterized protein YneF (UPF0154 family)